MSLIMKEIVVADDHDVVRMGIRKLLEQEQDMRITGEAKDGLQAVKIAREVKPDVVVLDLMMPYMNGIEATGQIKKELPKTRVLVLSMHKDDFYVSESLKKGAEAYVLKDSVGEHLVTAIRNAAAGRRFLSPPFSEQRIEAYLKASASESGGFYNTLTTRERQIFQMAAEGRSSSEIGNLLSISPRTVETHRAHMMHKLCLHNEAELIRYAIKKGLLTRE